MKNRVGGIVQHGLVKAKGNTQLLIEEQEAAQQSDLDQTQANADFGFVGHLRGAWSKHRRYKLDIERRLVACLRARRGEYSAVEISQMVANGGADPVYLKLTGTKTRAASSWVRDIILPVGEKPWSLDPTTLPDLPEPVKMAAQREAGLKVMELVQQGTLTNPQEIMEFLEKVKDESQLIINKQAKEAAVRMEEKIADQMEEGEWNEAIEEIIEDFVTYPTAFLKGPYYRYKDSLEWDTDGKPKVERKATMCWSRVSPFDMYPAPNAKNLTNFDLFERIKFVPETLYNYIGIKGYREDQIREVLEHHRHSRLKDWLWVDFERQKLEGQTTFLYLEDGLIDALHFYGKVKGDMLIDWGVETKNPLDPQKPYEVDAILIGNNIIRAVVNEDPIPLRPYQYACWDSVPGAIWGIALPEQMEDHQRIVNACARSLCANMALASGPQALVLTDLLAPGEDVTSIYPMKIWQSVAPTTGATVKPVDFFQPSMNAEPLLKVLETFEQKADDVTNVPRYSYGNQNVGGAGNTASGLSMLMNSAAKGIRRAVASLDATMIRPSVYKAFLLNMLNDPDPSIKGDCKVVPRGSTALLIKDQLQIRIQTFLQQTANPVDSQILGIKGRAALLRESIKLLDLPIKGIIPSDDDLDLMEKKQAAMQAQAEQGQPQVPEQPMGYGNEAQILQNKLNGNPENVG